MTILSVNIQKVYDLTSSLNDILAIKQSPIALKITNITLFISRLPYNICR